MQLVVGELTISYFSKGFKKNQKDYLSNSRLLDLSD